MAKKQSWCVRLGQPEWSRHTYPRPESDSLHLLGSVRRGLQVGALAKADDGEYFQVVGDYLVPLNKRQMELAVTKAAAAQTYTVPSTAPKSVKPPIVTVKRRRIPVLT